MYYNFNTRRQDQNRKRTTTINQDPFSLAKRFVTMTFPQNNFWNTTILELIEMVIDQLLTIEYIRQRLNFAHEHVSWDIED